MFRRASKHGEGRSIYKRLRTFEKPARCEARRQGRRKCSHALHKDNRDEVPLAADIYGGAGFPGDIYLCIDDNMVIYQDVDPKWLYAYLHPIRPSSPYDLDALYDYIDMRETRHLEPERWEAAQERHPTGLWPIQQWGFEGASIAAFEDLYRSRFTHALKGIVDLRLEYRQIKTSRLWFTTHFRRFPAMHDEEVEMAVYALIPSDDLVKFFIYDRVQARAEAMYSWQQLPSPWMLDPQGSGGLRVGVLYDGLEVATIEEDGMQLTKVGHCLRLRRMEETSRLHESRVCDDLYNLVMAYVECPRG